MLPLNPSILFTLFNYFKYRLSIAISLGYSKKMFLVSNSNAHLPLGNQLSKIMLQICLQDIHKEIF